MKYQVVRNGKPISPVIEKQIIAKLARLEKVLYKSDELECRIVVKTVGTLQKVEITIPTQFLILRSEVESADLLDAVDIAKEKLEKQIRKVKTRLDRSQDKTNLGRTFVLNEISDDVETSEVIVRTKSVTLEPMTLDDAVMQLEMLDHDFYVYRDVEDQTISIVYKRKDGGYGVLEIND